MNDDITKQGGAAVAHLVHTQEVAGSNPAPATNSKRMVGADRVSPPAPPKDRVLRDGGFSFSAAPAGSVQNQDGTAIDSLRVALSAQKESQVDPVLNECRADGDLFQNPIAISDDSKILLALCAAHFGTDPSCFLQILISDRAASIGIQALADAKSLLGEYS